MCLDPAERYFPVCSLHLSNFFFWFLLLCMCVFCYSAVCHVLFCCPCILWFFCPSFVFLSIYCSATNIANYSAWLFVHFLFIRRCMLLVCCPDSIKAWADSILCLAPIGVYVQWPVFFFFVRTTYVRLRRMLPVSFLHILIKLCFIICSAFC